MFLRVWVSDMLNLEWPVLEHSKIFMQYPFIHRQKVDTDKQAWSV